MGSSGNKVKRAREHGMFDYDGTVSHKLAKRWMEKANEVLTSLRIEESCKPGFVRYFLKGEAAEWWERMANDYGDGWSWLNFQSKFTIMILSPITNRKRYKFVTREQGEDCISVYAAKFVEFSKVARELSRRGSCSMFRGGRRLNPKVKSRMEDKEYLDLDELLRAALEAESTVSPNLEHRESKRKKVQSGQEATISDVGQNDQSQKAKRQRHLCQTCNRHHSGCCWRGRGHVIIAARKVTWRLNSRRKRAPLI